MLCGYSIKYIGVALILVEKEPKLKTTNREKRAHDANTAYPLDVLRSEVKALKVIISTRLGRPRRRGGWICCCRASGCSSLH